MQAHSLLIWPCTTPATGRIESPYFHNFRVAPYLLEFVQSLTLSKNPKTQGHPKDTVVSNRSSELNRDCISEKCCKSVPIAVVNPRHMHSRSQSGTNVQRQTDTLASGELTRYACTHHSSAVRHFPAEDFQTLMNGISVLRTFQLKICQTLIGQDWDQISHLVTKVHSTVPTLRQKVPEINGKWATQSNAML